MIISELGFWEISKLIFRMVFRDANSSSDASSLIDSLKENSLKNVKVIGRGGVEISVDEIKNSQEFIEMQNYAKIKVNNDVREQFKSGRTTDNPPSD